MTDVIEINCKDPNKTDAIISGISGFIGGIFIAAAAFFIFKRLRKSKKKTHWAPLALNSIEKLILIELQIVKMKKHH